MENLASSPVVEAAPTGAGRSSPSSQLRLKDAVLALSLANLVFIFPWFVMLFDEDHGYYNKLPVSTMTLAVMLLNLMGGALVVWLAVQVVRRMKNRLLERLAVVVFCAALLIPVNFVRLHYLHVAANTVIGLAQHPFVLGLAAALLVAALAWHRVAARVASAPVLILSPLVIFTVGKILMVLTGVISLEQHTGPDSPAPPLRPARPGPRVVWLILDELDQRAAFDARPPGLLLPELDRFARENLTATNAFPPGGGTMVSMPALTTGLPVFDAEPAGASEMRLTLAGTGETLLWSGQPNVFSRARDLGFNTGLVGWYHPYSRVLGRALNFCSWHPYPPFELGRGHTFSETMINQLWATVTPLQQRRLHVRVCERSRAEALNLVTNTQIGLLLLHLPGPHKPGCYDAEKGQFTLTSFHTARSYFDNLVLTDRTFGALRRALEIAGQWDDTWLLLSSDHWWREATAHDGRLDHRVPFIIKAPGANQPVTYAPAFNTLVTHDLLLAMLRREITNQPSASAWIDRHRIPPPTAYKPANSGR